MRNRIFIFPVVAGVTLALWLAQPNRASGESSVPQTNFVSPNVSSRPNVNLPKRDFNLPQPIAGDWRLTALDKTSMLANRENKLAGLMYLPTAIRNHLKRNPEEVPPMLETLIKLVGDADTEVSLDAALGLYDLGDYDGIALKRMEDLLKDSWQFQNVQGTDGYAQFELTEKVLNALQSANDHRLDDSIFESWQKQLGGETHIHQIDYAAFLEQGGRKLPEDYWAERARTHADSFALDLLKARYGKKYQSLFKDLYGKGNSWAAATLYEQTGDQKYADTLVQQVSKAVSAQPHIDVPTLASPLTQLSKIQPEKARDLVAPVLLDKNEYAVEVALDGLKTDQSAEAADLIYQAAANRFEMSHGEIPGQLVEALASRTNNVAQGRYDELKNSILGKPQPSWHNAGPYYTQVEFQKFDQMRPPHGN